MTTHFGREQLLKMFASVGKNVLVSTDARFFAADRIHLGDHARIDAFCILSAGQAGIMIGRYVHLGAGSKLFGGGGPILLEDFSGISANCCLYTATDDFTDGFMAHPTVPLSFRNITEGSVILRRHGLVGSGSIIMPGVEVGVGAAVGALSMVRDKVEPFAIVAGVPARVVGHRGRHLLQLEDDLLAGRAATPLVTFPEAVKVGQGMIDQRATSMEGRSRGDRPPQGKSTRCQEDQA
jgi:acetyltransferase-like isoleucine patch superfamily enzyme